MEGKYIKEIRLKLGWTQKQLADALGVTNMSVSKWENDIVKPHPVFAAKIEELNNAPE